MSQTLCKLCLFKSEPMDEILMEESQCLKEIVDDIFHKMVHLTKLELDGICTLCREKLKSFHEYYKFVLENQKVYYDRLESIAYEPLTKRKPEFIEVIKTEQPDPELEEKPIVDFEQKLEEDDDEEKIKYVPGPGDYEPPSSSSSDTDIDAYEQEKRRTKKNELSRMRYQKPRSHVIAVQQQQSDFVGLLFDFQCSYCPHVSTFKNLKSILNHYKNVHKKKKIWSCCGREMTLEAELIEHVLEHNGAPWKCTQCDEQYDTAVELWTHRNELHAEEPSKIPYEDPHTWKRSKYECDQCHMKFLTRTSISQHMKSTHIKNYDCYICGEMFYNKREVTKHREKEHANIQKSPCPICGIMIKNSSYLMTAHIKNIHENQSMICALCGKVCISDRTYRSHMNRSHRPPKHQCSYCNKSFKSKTPLLDHEAVHTGVSRYFCPVCGAQFKSLGNFSAHKRKLHPLEHQQQKMEREARKYQM